MKRIEILQRKITFLNIIKWFLLALLIGVIVGICNAMFLKLLEFSIGFTNQFDYYFLILPLALYVVNKLAKMSPKDNDYSTNQAIASINERKGVSLISSLKAFFLPIITIACGGSAGKESPCADVGAGVASTCAKIFSFNKQERRKLMICGVSAGFAGVFGVPISGALFGLEVLSVGTVFYEVMFPAFIAGITAFQVTTYLGVSYIYHPMNFSPVLAEKFFLKVIIAGLFFGLVSIILAETLKFTKVVFRFIALKTSPFWRSFIGGILLILIGLWISPSYLGLGVDGFNQILSGGALENPFGFFLKSLTTGITFAAGGVGGIITPVFFIGAQAGALLASWLGTDTATMAALGLVAVLAGAANTPLSASIMAIELFGAEIAPYAAVACVISFLMSGRQSVYASQRISLDKRTELPIAHPEKAYRAAPSKGLLLKTFKEMSKHLIPNPKGFEDDK